ncbi:hypothetical protein SNEBB_009102 [Seison nebaliae]|nr:hypothetical protein SNEBB_009102 [Seison nebaliae]
MKQKTILNFFEGKKTRVKRDNIDLEDNEGSSTKFIKITSTPHKSQLNNKENVDLSIILLSEEEKEESFFDEVFPATPEDKIKSNLRKNKSGENILSSKKENFENRIIEKNDDHIKLNREIKEEEKFQEKIESTEKEEDDDDFGDFSFNFDQVFEVAKELKSKKSLSKCLEELLELHTNDKCIVGKVVEMNENILKCSIKEKSIVFQVNLKQSWRNLIQFISIGQYLTIISPKISLYQFAVKSNNNLELELNDEKIDINKLTRFSFIPLQWINVKQLDNISDLLNEISGRYYGENFQSINFLSRFIINSNYCFSITNLLSFVNCQKKIALQSIIPIGNDVLSLPLVLGNMIHEYFQLLFEKTNLIDLENDRMLDEYLRSIIDLENIFGLGFDSIEQFYTKSELFLYLGNVRKWLKKYVIKKEILFRMDNEQFVIKRLISVEQHLWSMKFGLKGIVDVVVEVTNEKGKIFMLPIELKTGRNENNMDHRAQILLYSAMLQENDGFGPYSLLLYLKTLNSHVFNINRQLVEVKSLIQQRNKLFYLFQSIYLNLSILLNSQSKNLIELFKFFSIIDSTTGERQRAFVSDTSYLVDMEDELEKNDKEKNRRIDMTCKYCNSYSICQLTYKINKPSMQTHFHHLAMNHQFLFNWIQLLFYEFTYLCNYFKRNDMTNDQEHNQFYQSICNSHSYFDLIQSISIEKNLKNIKKLNIESNCLTENRWKYFSIFKRPQSTCWNISDYCNRKIIIFNNNEIHLSTGIEGVPIKVERKKFSEYVCILSEKNLKEVFSLYSKNFHFHPFGQPIIFRCISSNFNAPISNDEKSKENESKNLGTIQGKNLSNIFSLYLSTGNGSQSLTDCKNKDEIKFRLNELIILKKSPRINENDTKHKKLLQFHQDQLKFCNQKQLILIEQTLKSKDYIILRGYPGSGKTTTIVNLVKICLKLNMKVLLTSFTHSAVDNLLMKLLNDDLVKEEKFPQLIRIGKKDRVPKELHRFVSDELIEQEKRSNGTKTINHSFNYIKSIYESCKIVGTTSLSTSHSIFQRHDIMFDICIIDEATQMLLSSVLSPLFHCKKFVVVGDPNQLQPLIKWNEFKHLKNFPKSIFDVLYEIPDNSKEFCVNLNSQYRFNSPILEFVNKCFYSNSPMVHGRMKKCEQEETIGNYCQRELLHQSMIRNKSIKWIYEILNDNLESSIIFIDIKNSKELLTSTTKDQQYLELNNFIEINCIRQILQEFTSLNISQNHIGISSPFRLQVELMQKEFNKKYPQIEINTIDQYQGKDKAIFIVSFVKTQTSDKKIVDNVLSDWRRINVAISRAKLREGESTFCLLSEAELFDYETLDQILSSKEINVAESELKENSKNLRIENDFNLEDDISLLLEKFHLPSTFTSSNRSKVSEKRKRKKNFSKFYTEEDYKLLKYNLFDYETLVPYVYLQFYFGFQTNLLNEQTIDILSNCLSTKERRKRKLTDIYDEEYDECWRKSSNETKIRKLLSSEYSVDQFSSTTQSNKSNKENKKKNLLILEDIVPNKDSDDYDNSTKTLAQFRYEINRFISGEIDSEFWRINNNFPLMYCEKDQQNSLTSSEFEKFLIKQILQRKNKEINENSSMDNWNEFCEAKNRKKELFSTKKNIEPKYWVQRYRYFSRFDEGIQLDEESWYSVTQEKIAIHHAKRFSSIFCSKNYRHKPIVVIDGFCGCGGNLIQLALSAKDSYRNNQNIQIYGVDIDPIKIEMAKNNANIYGVSDFIKFICGDYLELIENNSLKLGNGELLINFLSPPWGGPNYQKKKDFDIETDMEISGGKLFEVTKKLTRNIVFYLPKNVIIEQLIRLADIGETVEIEKNILNGSLKSLTIYYGILAAESSWTNRKEEMMEIE